MKLRGRMMRRIGAWLGAFLTQPRADFAPPAVYTPAQLRAVLQPGDVLLVEGNLRISSLIQLITRSTWSHVALYVGPQPGDDANTGDAPCLVEAELGEGVVLSPLSKYAAFHTRICRAIGLRPEDRDRIVAHALSRVGHGYDFKHVVDLARLRLSSGALAMRVQRGLRTLGSGEPTRAICSTLIAQAFESVRYPILATRRDVPCDDAARAAPGGCKETWERRHFTLFAPGDFDVSPFFAVVKPPPREDFDYTRLSWAQ